MKLLPDDISAWADPDWHYVGFGITHAGLRDDCQTCTLSRNMVIAEAMEPYSSWLKNAGEL